jgi:hypothetical protein
VAATSKCTARLALLPRTCAKTFASQRSHTALRTRERAHPRCQRQVCHRKCEGVLQRAAHIERQVELRSCARRAEHTQRPSRGAGSIAARTCDEHERNAHIAAEPLRKLRRQAAQHARTARDGRPVCTHR